MAAIGCAPLRLSLLFYEAQRSGKLPDTNRFESSCTVLYCLISTASFSISRIFSIKGLLVCVNKNVKRKQL
jgi:hypothetical protein